MREKIERYTRKLEGLSTEELSRSAEKLVSLQRRNDAALIAHLVELSRRNGHLELGYKSLFYYCVEFLRLGESSAWKRTQVAGVAGRFPQVLEQLAQGKVNLSVLSILAKHLTEENFDRLLKEAEGKTTREAKEIVVAFDPKPAAKPTIRKKPVRSRDCVEVTDDRAGMAVSPSSEETGTPATRSARGTGTLEVAQPEFYNFKFSAGKEFREKFERLAEVLGIVNAERNMPEIIERALDLALDKKDPKRKLERRRRREAAAARPSTGSAGVPPASSPEKVSMEEKTRPEETARRETRAAPPGAPASRPHLSRYIPSSVRERVLERAGYQCEWTGSGGVGCSARTGLEIDHIKSYAKGGGRGEANLRVLCQAHNLFSATREFGDAFRRGRIEGTENRASQPCEGISGESEHRGEEVFSEHVDGLSAAQNLRRRLGRSQESVFWNPKLLDPPVGRPNTKQK